MKKQSRKRPDPEMLGEYDFAGGKRGKYARRYARGSNVVVLHPDVAKVFPDSESANRALRACIEMIEKVPRRRAKARG
ncbi:MAG: hypothetical protein ACE5I3_07135 [Phycisphaerae bacterium]